MPKGVSAQEKRDRLVALFHNSCEVYTEKEVQKLAAKLMPSGAVDGVLMFVGYEGIVGTALFQRTLMMLTPKREFDRSFHGLRKRRISLYTGLQLVLLALCWLINKSPFGLAVAFLIVALVPLRERLLPRLFSADELARLDVHSDQVAGEDESGLQAADSEDREEEEASAFETPATSCPCTASDDVISPLRVAATP